MAKSLIIKIAVFSVLSLAVGGLIVFNSHSVLAQQSCPQNTTAQETQATLVGEITDTGGDPNLTVWFQYGLTSAYGNETSRQSKYGLGLFCATIYNLTPCTTYHYRAVAQNSAGTSFGEDKTFTTKCFPARVDLKANGSDGPINLRYQDYVTLSWTTSENVVSCTASGDWSGSKSPSGGNQSIQLTVVKDYTFTITCTNSSGQTNSDSVTVKVSAIPPTVITKPAIVTY